MDSKLIAAWVVAYQQFADILIASEKAKYKAGQYISIRVTMPEIGQKQPRQYTLSNTFNEQEYRICVKKQGSTETISFIHAFQNAKVVAMATTVRAIEAEMPQVKTYLACEASEDETLRVVQVGYLDLNKLDEELLPKNADFYLFGPIGFMQAQYNSLIDLGIEKAQIHMELFGTSGVGIE